MTSTKQTYLKHSAGVRAAILDTPELGMTKTQPQPQLQPHSKELIVAVDVDGVLANLIEGVRRQYSCPMLPEPTEWDKLLPVGADVSYFWNHVYPTCAFYAQVPIYDWAYTLTAAVSEVTTQWFFLSSCASLNGLRAKAHWLASRYSNERAVLLHGVDKTSVHYDVLIDDKPSIENQSKVLSFPQRYNSAGRNVTCPAELHQRQWQFVDALIPNLLSIHSSLQHNKTPNNTNA